MLKNLVDFNHRSVSLADRKLVAAHGDFHRIAQRSDLLHLYLHTLGDTHLYLNHLEQAAEQLSREPRPLPRLRLNPEVRSIADLRYEDIEIVDYNPHPAIKAPMSF